MNVQLSARVCCLCPPPPPHRQNVGLAVRLQKKTVEVANASQDRVEKLATDDPALATLHSDLKVTQTVVSGARCHQHKRSAQCCRHTISGPLCTANCKRAKIHHQPLFRCFQCYTSKFVTPSRTNTLPPTLISASTLRMQQVKAVIAENLLAVLCDPSKKVGQLLEGLSCVAHLLLILFRARGPAVVTAQLYHDLQATIRGIFYCVLQVQAHCPAMPMFLWQIGTDALENLFAVVRTLTHGSNIDGKELADRLGAAVTLEEIYAKHPNWAQKSRRLNDSTDHMNVKTWTEAGPAGSCDVRDLDVAERWNERRRTATSVLQAHQEYAETTQATFDGFEADGITMFFPFG